MSDETRQTRDPKLNRRRVLGMLGGGTASAILAGVGAGHPHGGPNDRSNGNNEDNGNNGNGVGPCTCVDPCPEGTFCGKLDGPPKEGETYAFSNDEDSFSVTIEHVTKKEGNEPICFTFSSSDDVQRVCIKGGPYIETYTGDDLDGSLCAPTNPGGQQAAISNVSFCGTAGRYYQIDLVGGEPIEVFDPDEGETYHMQDRMLTAYSVSSTGTMTEYPVQIGETTVTVDGEECVIAWDDIEFDATTQTAVVDVALRSTDHPDGECAVTYAAYELPDGQTTFDPDTPEEQEFVTADTETLETGTNTTLEIDLDA